MSHRVYRVQGFLSSHPNWPNWLPPPSHPQASVAPPPLLVPGAWGWTLARGRGGGGGDWEPIRSKGQTLWYSRYKSLDGERNAALTAIFWKPIQNVVVSIDAIDGKEVRRAATSFQRPDGESWYSFHLVGGCELEDQGRGNKGGTTVL